MRKLLLVLLVVGCSEAPVTEEPNVIFDAPPVLAEPEPELSVEADSEEDPCEQITDAEEHQWCVEQHTPEQMLTSGRLSAIQVGEIRRRMRMRRDRVNTPQEMAEAWGIPEIGMSQAETEALGMHRICGSETEWHLDDRGRPMECAALLQVIHVIRAGHCDNRRFRGHSSRNIRISQCRREDGSYVALESDEAYVEGAEETLLSAMRRASKYVMRAAQPRSSRQRWVRNVTLDCEQPEEFPEDRSWDRTARRGRISLQGRCERSAALYRSIFVEGEAAPRPIRRVRPVTWGGRCERICTDVTDRSTCSNRGACDDRLPCNRNLARIPNLPFLNAVWCRPGSRGCPRGIDPVCRVFRPELPDHVFAEEGEEDAAVDESRAGEGSVQDPQEGVQRGDVSPARPVVLDLHGVPGDGERQAGGAT